MESKMEISSSLSLRLEDRALMLLALQLLSLDWDAAELREMLSSFLLLSLRRERMDCLEASRVRSLADLGAAIEVDWLLRKEV